MHPILLLCYAALFVTDFIVADTTQRFNLTRVTNDTFALIDTTKSTFSLQGALFPENSYSGVDSEDADSGNWTTFLFAYECQQDGSAPNCTASCTDTSLMFANLQTLHNCMVFPQVAAYLYNDTLTEDAYDLADELGIEPSRDGSELSRSVTGLIKTCLMDYCNDTHGCQELYNTATDSEYATAYRNSTNWSFDEDGDVLVDSICDSLRPQFRVNSDIGGIGVYVSYWIQTGIALLGFLATLIWTSWTYHVYRAAFALRFGLERAHDKARRICEKNQKHLARLAAALTDFQKAQCFFTVAINIATQVAYRRGGLQPAGLQQIYNTYIFMKVLAMNGYLPITFNLFTLHIIGMVSWYLLALSVLSVALSVVTLGIIGEFQLSTANFNDLASVFSANGPESCGHAQLGAFCYVPIEDDEIVEDTISAAGISDTAWRILAFCLVILLLLIFEKTKILEWPTTQRSLRWLSSKLTPCWRFIAGCVRKIMKHQVTKRILLWTTRIWSTSCNAITRSKSWIQPKFVTQRALARRLASWRASDRTSMAEQWIRRHFQQSWVELQRFHQTANYTQVSLKIIVASFYVVFACLYINWFNIFLRFLAWFAKYGYYSQEWNFGQIIAITVWAPPLCEYIHLELRGMKRGFDHKLLPPYRVTKAKNPKPNIKTPPKSPPQITALAGGLEKGDYESLDNPHSPESGGHHSEPDLSWHLPATVLPQGDLSPFSSP